VTTRHGKRPLQQHNDSNGTTRQATAAARTRRRHNNDTARQDGINGTTQQATAAARRQQRQKRRGKATAQQATTAGQARHGKQRRNTSTDTNDQTKRQSDSTTAASKRGKLQNGHGTFQNNLKEVPHQSKISSPARKNSSGISQPRPYKDQDTIVDSTRCDINTPMSTVQSTMTRQRLTTMSHCDKKNPGED